MIKVMGRFLYTLMAGIYQKKGSMGNKISGGQTVLIIVMRTILHIILITLDLGVVLWNPAQA